jgi:hypothetical protein
MRLAFAPHAVFDSSLKAVTRGTVAIALFGAIIIAGSTRVQALGGPECPGGIVPPGNGTTDLVISHECHVGGGIPYKYKHVNIVSDGKLNVGSLIFDEADATLNLRIEFFATSILVENGGTLMAGTPAKPFGTRGGVLTIHLYGDNQGNTNSGQGIICKSPVGDAQDAVQCGIPDNIWKTNGNGENKVPELQDDYFYRYGPLPYDDKKDGLGHEGYFGYKVLAVSFGGTLQLFGKKGAVYAPEPGAQDPGISWMRLDGDIFPADAAKSLKVTSPGFPPTLSRVVDKNWDVGDHVVVTTTDYLPDHSEELVICKPVVGNTIDYDANLDPAKNCLAGFPATGVKWIHSGTPFDLARVNAETRLNITKPKAETRAAVGLLSRSIRIVSEGDKIADAFPAAPAFPDVFPPNPAPMPGYYFGGHTIARQGFKLFQVQGVEFKQLGQGGRLGHYPVHFHMARRVPPNTFVKDSSINESMTRWITVHGTQGVELARNVGYLSIGHGFYLEDAVETENQLYSNLGVFARAAIPNLQNPRLIPGILASPDETANYTKFESDKVTPSVFWITNGWNDFQGNMAAGAGMCGVCFWQVPANISGGSLGKKWDYYASEQIPVNRASSPMYKFDGNFCTSANASFQTVGNTEFCLGTRKTFPANLPFVVLPVPNPRAPPSTAVANPMGKNPPPKCGPGTPYPFCPDDYYPQTDGGNLGAATLCTTPKDEPCAPTGTDLCGNDNQTNCVPTVINNYTTSFNWPSKNFAAIWLRTRWHVVSNSFVSDVQNGGVSFLTGGDYTHASATVGIWELALKTVFVGHTQPQQAADATVPDPKINPYASVLGPFNNVTNGLGFVCDNPKGAFCLSVNNSFNLNAWDTYTVSERMFNIYDGPANEDSNAFLDINKIDLKQGPPPTNSVYNGNGGRGQVIGIPKVAVVDPVTPKIPTGNCYIPNAAIAWKQPNGFYYPPTFHSRNLFFDNVDIRHYVIVPQFTLGTYTTNKTGVINGYCTPTDSGLQAIAFTNFTAIDQQTELTDTDGSLTGYAKAISVNEDPFFRAPIDGLECQSDGSVPIDPNSVPKDTASGTARTSPYDYVSTVVYPDSARSPLTPPDHPPPPPFPPRCRDVAEGQPTFWDSNCANPNCFGVPLYRELQTGSEHKSTSLEPSFIRMSGADICQRQTMTVNHGLYYVDVTASLDTQKAWTPMGVPADKNVFQGGKTYDFFLLHAKAISDNAKDLGNTEQTYQMFVGIGLDTAKVLADVNLIRVQIPTFPLVICPDPINKNPACPANIGGNTSTLIKDYKPGSGILTVTLNLSAFKNDFDTARQALCQPGTFCQWTGTTATGSCVPNGSIGNLSADERKIACGYAGKDIDCPTGGCVGFSVKLPAQCPPGIHTGNCFDANDQTTKSVPTIPKALATCYPNVKDPATNPWWIDLSMNNRTAIQDIAKSCYKAKINSVGDFCP